MNPSVTQSFTQAIMRHLELLDIQLDPQLRLQIDQYQGTSRLPMAIQDTMWKNLEAQNDGSLGLNIGLAMMPQSFDTMGFLLLSSPSLGVAVDSLVNYSSLIGEGGTFSKSHTKQGWKLCYDARFNVAVALRIEAIIASIAAGARWLSGKKIVPVAVFFKHPQQADTSLYQHVFKDAQLHFSHRQNAIVYADDDWNLKQREVNPAVQEQMLQLARQQLAQLKPQNIPGQVEALLTHQPWLSRAQIAAGLAMSERTLSRKLSATGLSYQSMANRIRKQHALEQIAKPGTTQAALADDLGYNDQSAFAKAFKRWTGMGFRQYRQHLCC